MNNPTGPEEDERDRHTEVPAFRLCQQHGKNDCYIACAAMLVNYFLGTKYTVEAIESKFGADPNVASSCLQLVSDIYEKDVNYKYLLDTDGENELEGPTENGFLLRLPMDSHAVPSMGELLDNLASIEERTNDDETLYFLRYSPVLCCVGTRRLPRGEYYVRDYRIGHWVIISGAGYDENGTPWILVCDPGLKDPTWIQYDSVRYLRDDLKVPMYWENATWCDLDEGVRVIGAAPTKR